MKTYVLTDEMWRRGQGGSGSYVYAPDPNAPLCCLGNVLRQEEVVSAAQTECISTLNHLKNLGVRLPLPLDRLPGLIRAQVYRANDTKQPPSDDARRVAEINALTEPYGFRFEFRGDA